MMKKEILSYNVHKNYKYVTYLMKENYIIFHSTMKRRQLQ